MQRQPFFARIAGILSTASRPTLAQYLRGSLRADAVAGLTVAVMGVPQAMAYAMIAGLDPVFGLYTAIVTCTVAALLGSSNHLVTGPTNGLCIVLLGLTGALAEGVDPFEAILLLSLMSGCIQLAFGLLRLGNIVRYVANSVVIGFTAGAGILIATNQLRNVLDIETGDAKRTYEVLFATFERLGDTNPYALIVGTLTAAIVLLPKMHKRLARIPGALIGVVAAGGLSYWMGWHLLEDGNKVLIAKDIGHGIVGSLDIFHVPEYVKNPDFGLTQDMFAGAFAITILSLIEATSISRIVARSSRQKLDFNREFIGQGVSKIVGSFFMCFAGSGSFTRTAVCYRSGGRTRMAAVFSAFWTALTLLLFAPVANYIPKAALAGMIIVIAYSMVDMQRIKLSWQSGSNSQIVLLGTMIATLVLPLEYAIYIGVMLSLVVILRATGKTDLTALVACPDGDYDEVPLDRAAPTPVVTINMSGDIYFAAAEDLDSELLRALSPKTRVVVLRMKRLRAAGSTAMAMLEHFWVLLSERQIYLVVCGVERDLETLMTSTGLRRKIGEENIFYADNKLFQSTKLAMARATAIYQRYERAHSKGKSSAKPDATQSVLVTAKSLMTTRFPLFGCEHQTREAAWLLTETQKFKRSINPEPLFLQDRNGALFGELSRWHVLKALIEGSDPDEDEGLDDRQVAKLLRRNFTRRINHIARTDVVHQRPDTPITALLRVSTDNDQAVVPICDEGGRLKGYCMSHAMLIGLQDSLARLEAVEAEEEAAANADQVEASEPNGDELGGRNDG
ncbi:MAG: SulP family sulfate permease [Planctomycetota bacterium]|jgi:SulP family sulfate permease